MKSCICRLDPATPTEGFRPPSKAAEQRPQQPTNQNAPPVASAAKPGSHYQLHEMSSSLYAETAYLVSVIHLHLSVYRIFRWCDSD